MDEESKSRENRPNQEQCMPRAHLACLSPEQRLPRGEDDNSMANAASQLCCYKGSLPEDGEEGSGCGAMCLQFNPPVLSSESFMSCINNQRKRRDYYSHSTIRISVSSYGLSTPARIEDRATTRSILANSVSSVLLQGGRHLDAAPLELCSKTYIMAVRLASCVGESFDNQVNMSQATT
jgi:hypothetical protein